MTFATLHPACGVLVHPTAFPSEFDIGDLGPGADDFVDALADNEVSCWQTLPMGPTDPGCSHSPYSSTSAFAGNPLLVSPEQLSLDGMIAEADMPAHVSGCKTRVDFDGAMRMRGKLFEDMLRHTDGFRGDKDFELFMDGNASWVEDYARFAAFKARYHGRPWYEWPDAIRDREPNAENRLATELSHDIRREIAIQYVFQVQWKRLHEHCRQRGVRVFGDMPIYVQHDSADVWANPELYRLDASGMPTQVAGVPPDYFSEDGQLWGNPLYNWDAHAEEKFAWWMKRFERCADMCDIVRIDHFRGFVGCWVIGAGEETAKNGHWESAPAFALFWSVMKAFRDLIIVAEDLGDITDDVRAAMRNLGLPGMKVLEFAFGDSREKWLENPYLPHNIGERSVVYTGTHDNETLAEMLLGASEYVKGNIREYAGVADGAVDLSEVMVRLALESDARLAMFPMQDILKLGEEARFNKPGTTGPANWSWRLSSEQLQAFRAGIPWFQEALRSSGRNGVRV